MCEDLALAGAIERLSQGRAQWAALGWAVYGIASRGAIDGKALAALLHTKPATITLVITVMREHGILDDENRLIEQDDASAILDKGSPGSAAYSLLLR